MSVTLHTYNSFLYNFLPAQQLNEVPSEFSLKALFFPSVLHSRVKLAVLQ